MFKHKPDTWRRWSERRCTVCGKRLSEWRLTQPCRPRGWKRTFAALNHKQEPKP